MSRDATSPEEPPAAPEAPPEQWAEAVREEAAPESAVDRARRPAGAFGDPRTLDPEALAAVYGLEPLPREGGRFRRTWAGPGRADGRPEGSATVHLLTSGPGDYLALHRLPRDEVWHHYLGDPLTLLLLPPEGRARTVILGPDVLGGQRVQLTVEGGTWVGAAVGEGGAWALFGCTMAPGFTFEDYEAGHADTLVARYPEAAARVVALCRPH